MKQLCKEAFEFAMKRATTEQQKRMIRDYTIMGIAALIGLSAVGWMVWLISISV